LSDTFFTLTRQQSAAEDDVALCTFNSRGKRTAICAEVADSEVIEVDFSNDCSTFELVIYTPKPGGRQNLVEEYPLVKRETCVKVGA